VVGQQNADIADALELREIAMANIFGFLYMPAHWRHLANMTEPSMCGGVRPYVKLLWPLV